MGVASDIAANPEGYYVNVHTSDFPDGAVRAQLEVFGEDETIDTGMITDTTPEASGY